MTSSTQTRPAEHPPTDPRLDGRVLVFGEALFDHFPDGSRVLGGAPFNVAWHLCGFGGDPIFVSAVGDDEDGREILDRMTGWGITNLAVLRDPEHATGRADIHPEGGSPRFEIPEEQAWDHITPPRLGHGTPALLYHGTLALRTEANLRRCFALRERFDVPVFVDLNLRSPWWTPDVVERCVTGADWVKLSDDELTWVTGAPTDTEAGCTSAARRFRDAHGAGRVLVTRGPRGAVLLGADGDVISIPGEDGRGVIDTVGAGDAFAALMCLGAVSGWSDRVAMDRAAAFARDICRIRGATDADLSLYEKHVRRWSRPTALGPEEHQGLHVLSLSVHGLVRGADIELGRDADTGGQVSYVVDQARALAAHPLAAEVTLVTRLVEDHRVDDAYAVPEEPLADNARLVRLPFGPRRYLRKERLWPYLDELLDQLTRWVRTQERPPDVIHGHYADAGYVGAQFAKLLGVPFVFTGHSLGRVKRERLLADGLDEDTLEDRYRITRRIEAEEQALEAADLVIASTRQEVREQFERYDLYVPERMRIIPPGVDLDRFSPPPPLWAPPAVARELARFLVEPEKPLILAIARADERKNFAGLIRAYAETPGLRDRANLAVVAGNRDDIGEMPAGPRRVLNRILHLVDRYDLYGSVAYPKHHGADDVPELYRFAAHTKGVFVNAALTEPFGLTLLEAAATGLPVVATHDGGPRDILDACDHGLLVDPLDTEALGGAMLDALTDAVRWGRWSKNGVSRVHARFSWTSHAGAYLEAAEAVRADSRAGPVGRQPTRLTTVDRLLVAELGPDQDPDDGLADLADLAAELEQAGGSVGFGIVTQQELEPALARLEELGAPEPDVLVTASGTAIHYGRHLIRDRSWERRIRYRWEPDAVEDVLAPLAGVALRDEGTTRYRRRVALAGPRAPSPADVRTALRQAGLRVTVVDGPGDAVDIVPVRAAPDLALRFFCFKWNLEHDQVVPAWTPADGGVLAGFFAQAGSEGE
jgi:sucrose-phosphate synthase